MSLGAAVVLARAHAARLTVGLEGTSLRLRGPAPSPDLIAEIKVHKPELITLLVRQAANAAGVQVGELGEPLTPCGDCGGGRSWRLSRTDPGFSGRWWCAACSPPPADRWCDAAVVPAMDITLEAA